MIAFALLYAIGIAGGVRLGTDQWTMLVGVHMLAIIPFALIGLGIG